jgi:hypothetical protein
VSDAPALVFSITAIAIEQLSAWHGLLSQVTEARTHTEELFLNRNSKSTMAKGFILSPVNKQYKT